jgi:hypothetical protein
MDAERFDRLTRALRTSPSRRLTLQGLAMLGLAALLGEEVQTVYANKNMGGGKKGKGKKKKKNNNDSSCTFDSDCNGNPNGPVCCSEEGPPQCEKCCLTGNRGCPAGQICSAGTYEDPNVCITNPFP